VALEVEEVNWLFRMAVATAVLITAWIVWQRVFVTDEKRIQRQIAVMEQAVEQGNILRLEGAIAQDYADDFGLDKSSLLGAVRSFRQQYDALFIHISDLQITVAGDKQTGQAVLVAKVLAKPPGAVQETEVRADRFRLFLRKTDTGWKLYRVETPELKFE
jgi:hypothetical protein